MKKMYVQTGKGVDEYCVDSLPKVKSKGAFELCQQKVKLFNKKYTDEFTLNYCGIGKFTRLANNQPSRQTLCRALLWSNGDYYKIKFASFTDESGFVSSLSCTICENDVDKDVVIIKKWGTSVEDVYIYYEDLLSLIEQSETLTQKEERLTRDISNYIREMVRIYLCGTKDFRNDLQTENEFHYNEKHLRFWKLKRLLDTFDKKLIRICVRELVKCCDEDIENYTNYKTVYINTEGREAHFKKLLKETIIRKKFISDLLND